MTETSSVQSVVELRAQMRGNVRLRFEVLAAISKTARQHGVEISNEALGNLVLVDSSEMEEELIGVGELPGGTNC